MHTSSLRCLIPIVEPTVALYSTPSRKYDSSELNLRHTRTKLVLDVGRIVKFGSKFSV